MLERSYKVADLQSLETPEFDERFVFSLVSEYDDRGWSTLPLIEKRPAISSWKELQTRRPTPDEIAEWHGASDPKFTNVGIVTGSVSRLVVVDCDSPAAAEYWIADHPQTPLRVNTGGGGQHFYYQLPDGATISNRVKMGGLTIDLRAEGGYVVAPPSRHPNGNLYRWSQWGDYCLADVPMFDERWIEPSPTSTTNGRARGKVQNGPAYIRKIVAISGQSGHNATYRAACRLRDAGLSPVQAMAELIIWNETNAHPAWSVRELSHKVEEAYKKRS